MAVRDDAVCRLRLLSAGGARLRLNAYLLTPRIPIQETTFSVQFVPVMRFLVFEFAVYDQIGGSTGEKRGVELRCYAMCCTRIWCTRCPVLTWRMLLHDVRY
eukprot:2687377-Rhodomonas_salina.2